MTQTIRNLAILLLGFCCLASVPMVPAEVVEFDPVPEVLVVTFGDQRDGARGESIPQVGVQCDTPLRRTTRGYLPASISHGLRSFMGVGRPLTC